MGVAVVLMICFLIMVGIALGVEPIFFVGIGVAETFMACFVMVGITLGVGLIFLAGMGVTVIFFAPIGMRFPPICPVKSFDAQATGIYMTIMAANAKAIIEIVLPFMYSIPNSNIKRYV